MPLESRDLLPTLTPWLEAPRWWLALSGGVDSMVLLQLLHELRAVQPLPPLAAVHVNHQLHPAAADWAQHCADACSALDIPLHQRDVAVAVDGDGPEAAARKARYEVFEDILGAGELLLMAHHADDQVETFFLRLMRGAGARGLSGMPVSRDLGAGQLVRPLLAVTREQIEAFATERSLSWIEDDSNQDPGMDRNFLRHNVLPELAKRWPGFRGSVLRSMAALDQDASRLADLDRQRLSAAFTRAYGEPVLDLDALVPADEAELATHLRHWLESEGLQPVAQARLEEFARQALEGREDSQPSLTLGTLQLQRYQNRLHLSPLGVAERPHPVFLVPGEVVTVPGFGEFEMQPVEGPGARLPARGGWELRFREGGERCQPVGRAASQSLKKLLQESGVPPWVRERLPLLYDGGELAVVGDMWVCEGHQATPHESGFQLRWQAATGALPD